MRLILISTFLTFFISVNAQYYIDLERVAFPSSTAVGTPFEMTFSIHNNSTDPITDITVVYKPSGGETVRVGKTFSAPVNPDENREFAMDDFTCNIQGREIYGEFDLQTVNGKTNYGRGTYIYLFCANETFPKSIVVEELTGTSCGYCPRGIVSMEHMRNNVTDGSWIGISVQKDAMRPSTAYSTFFEIHPGNTPSAVINRDFSNIQSPMPAILEDLHANYTARSAEMGITASCEYLSDTKTAIVSTTTRFAFDNQDNPYRLNYIITEDSVGPYYQYNYYANGAHGPMGGWENQNTVVENTYNDIAREGSIYHGVDTSLPSNVTAGKDYPSTQSIDCSSVTNPSNAFITIMGVNKNNGLVENATRIPLMSVMTSCVNVGTDCHADKTYDLMGKRTANRSGLMISNQKIMIKQHSYK